MRNEQRTAIDEQLRRWIPALLAVAFCLWLLRSFLVPIAWGFIIAVASWPVYRRFRTWASPAVGSTGAALVFTLLVTLVVIGPFVYAIASLGGQARAWAGELEVAEARGLATPSWLPGVPMAGDWLSDHWRTILGTPGGLTRWLNRTDTSWLLPWAGTLGGVVVRHLMIIVFTVLALFFLYRGGEPLAQRITQTIHARFGATGDRYFQRASVAIRAMMTSMVVVSLIDGVLCGVAFWITGLPSPHVWAAFTGLLAMIPFLAYVAVAAAALVLAAQSGGTAALVVLGFGTAVIFIADKFVRTALVGSAMNLGFFWVLVGTLAGFETFGFLGLFIGPVIVALTGALLRESLPAAPD